MKLEQINRNKRPGMKYFLFFLSEVNMWAKSVALSKRKDCSKLFFAGELFCGFCSVYSQFILITLVAKKVSVLVYKSRS